MHINLFYLFLTLFFANSLFANEFIFVKGGIYYPFYENKDKKKEIVEDFYLSKKQVTNKEFIKFVKENPKWKKSKISKFISAENYLKHWSGDLEFDEKYANLPIVNVSWFAAQA